MATAETAAAISGRYVYKRKDADLRDIAGLVREAILHAEFRVSRAENGRPAIWMGKCEGDQEVQLHIGNDAVIDFDMGQGTGRPVLGACIDGGK